MFDIMMKFILTFSAFYRREVIFTKSSLAKVTFLMIIGVVTGALPLKVFQYFQALQF